MPIRPPIDPEGYYHVGSRGSYGQLLFRNDAEHELFLSLYERSAKKYHWETLGWVLMGNHHHFALRLTKGGLSEGWREIHGGFSRRIHAVYGMTGQGHLVRHGFFARQLHTDGEIIAVCRYIDLNYTSATGEPPEASPWGGYRATIGLEHPRRFHSPAELLSLISQSPTRARTAYRALIEDGLVFGGHVSSPNDGYMLRG
jgi:REP element-mobilizing transposase RayT